MSIDPIANLLTSLRNGYSQAKETVIVPFSNLKLGLCQTLKQNQYIEDFKTDKKNHQLAVKLRYLGKAPAITYLKRISKPGQRIYCRAKNIPHTKTGRGIIILSTPGGLLTHWQARKKRLGGEIICEVA